MTIELGQIYASKHIGDILGEVRQRRRVVKLEPPFVWLQTEDGVKAAAPSRVRLRSVRSRTIPGYRLVTAESNEGDRS